MAPNIFTCFIIGEDNLHLECAKIIQQQGQQIIGIISAYEAAELWALQQGIPHYASLAAAQEALNKTPFDYLFSIVNAQILPAAILNLPRQLAINFHDAPLPRYAGVHATSWAILNQEKTHGITWHVATETVDAGDILQQVMVPITEDETALSLNLKCYEAALQSFPELVKSLANHSYQRQPQDLRQRTYFGLHQKPAGDGWIDWNASAEDIERLFRATQFGSYPNRFTCPKFKLSFQPDEPSSQQGSWEDEFIITQLELLPEPSTVAPGTIVATTEEYWRVATATCDIAIRQICTLEGDAVILEGEGVLDQAHPSSGLRPPSPTRGEGVKLRAYEARAEISPLSFETLRSSGRMGGRGDLNSGGGDEAYWVSQWQSIEPAKIPFLNFNHLENKSSFLLPLWEKVAEGRMRGEPSEFTPHPPAYPEPVEGAPSPTRGEEVMPGMYERRYYHLQQWTLPTSLQKLLHQHYPTHDFNTLLLALWLVYFYRLGNQPNVGVLLQLPDQNASHPSDLDPGIHARTSLELPYFTVLQDGLHFGQVVSQLQDELQAMQQKGSYLRDIFYRYPILTEVKHAVFTAVVIGEINQLQKSRAALVLGISAKDYSLSWHVDQNCLTQEPYLKTILDQMPGHLETLLTAITTQPETPIADLVLLTPQEQQQILIDWNQTETDYPRDKTIPQLFEEQVQKHPNKIAVCFENQSLTYRELNQQANQLAHYLSQQGVVAETLVAICMERSIEMIIGILGILKAGGAYVPIDPEYPRARIKFIFEDCRAMFVLTQSRLAKKIHAITDGAVITVDKIKNIKIHNKESISLNFDSSQLAYVIYTSGTTGKPKGVLIKHQAVVNTVLAKLRKFAINHSDRILNFSTLSFDASVWEIFPCLFAGATLYLARKENLLPGSKLTHFLEKNKITIATLVPSILAITPPPSTSHLRIIISAGESCSKAVVKQWENVAIFVNAYGPTEFTICAAMAIVGKDANKITIGRPIANTKIFILDDKMQLLPVGITGELYVTGHGLAKGYLNRDALTKSKFIPWALEHGTKEVSQIVYKTGDLARWLPDGNLEYMGRVDEQIKILGCRAELGELEEIAVTYPNILQAAACLDTTAEKNQINLFFVNKSDRNAIDIAKFNRFLKKQVPRYTVPSKIIEVARFPRTVNGKIDKNLLLKKMFFIKQPVIEPPSIKETLLLEIFQKILRIDSLHLEDDFFLLGGDSILAMHLVSKINALGFHCSVRDVFEASTIKKLVIRLHKKNPIEPIALLSKDFSLTPIQRWFFAQSFRHPKQFVQICWLEFQKPINSELLVCCLREIIEWHEIFRLRFKKKEGIWQQYYADKVHESCTDFPVIDNSSLVIQDFANEWVMNVAQDFNFETGYLLKVALVRQQGKITHLLLAAHHLIMDGVSWQIFFDDLQSLYAGSEKEGNNWQKFANSTSYQQWVYALENYIVSSQFKAEQSHWQGVDPFTYIPIDHHQGTNTEKSAEYVTVTLTEEETQRLLRTLAKTHHLNTDEILIALLAKSLMRWCQTDCITLDIERHGREELTTEINLTGTLGWFTSLFPLRLSCNKNLSLLEIIQSVQQQLQTVPRHGISYGLQHYFSGEWKPKSSLHEGENFTSLHAGSRHPAGTTGRIAFNYWGQLDQAFAQNFFTLGELKLLSHPENIRPYLITIDAVIKNKQLQLSWAYSRNFHRHETIQDLAQNFVTDLRNLLTNTQLQKPKISYALTAVQQGLLFEQCRFPQAHYYQAQACWELKLSGHFDAKLLQAACRFLVQRHDVLRTRFVVSGSQEPTQFVEESMEVPCDIIDLQQAKDPEVQLTKFRLADQAALIHWQATSLLRVQIVLLPENRCYLILHFNHMILDGWSFSILVKEFHQYCQAQQQGLALNLPPTYPFADYVHWLQHQSWSASQAFWKNYLAKFNEPVNLKVLGLFDATAEKTELSRCEFVSTPLSSELGQKLQHFCQMQHISLNTFFQALWGILLHRYTQTPDIVTGMTVSGRNIDLPQIQERVGLFINSIPLRQQFVPEITVLAHLQQLQKTITCLIPHSTFPLAAIQACSALSTAEHPLFDSLVVFENYPQATQEEIEFWDPTHYGLTLLITQGSCLKLKLGYDCQRINIERVQNLLEHLQHLLTVVLDNPQQQIARLPLLTTAEYQKLFAPTQTVVVLENVVSCFQKQVVSSPHHPALVWEGQVLSYQDLENQSNQLAHYLATFPHHGEMPIGVCLPRCPELVISLLAIWKMGGAYLPLNPDYPTARLQSIVDSHQVNLLISKNMIQKLTVNHPILLDQVQASICQQPTYYPQHRIQLTDLAAILTTSGTTGNPKSIAQEHKTLANLVHWQHHAFASSAKRRVTQLAAMNFDVSLQEITYALAQGDTLYIVPETIKQSLAELLRFLAINKIQQAFLTTALLEVFCEAALFFKPNLNYLTEIYVAGEALKISGPIKQFFSQNPHIDLVNEYGPTETHVVATHRLSVDTIDNWPYLPPIGRAIDNIRLYVLDAQLQALPIGIPGELYIGGVNLARGYLHNDKLTQEKFVPNPFDPIGTSRLYRTGDQVQWNAAGELLYLGRYDDQVKIRGFRIDPQEIEEALLTHSTIQQCLVTVISEEKSAQLVCYFVPSDKNEDAESLRHPLRKILPDHLIPTYFIRLQSFPLTRVGKIDRQALPRPEQRNAISNTTFRHAYEQQLAELWSEILLCTCIDREVSFWALGGDSIKALRLLFLIEHHLQVTLSLQDFFTAPSIAQMSDRIRLTQADKVLQNQWQTLDFKGCHLPSPLVPLQTTGEKTPLFIIHPIGGTVFAFLDLVRYLGNERPIYGIQDPNVADNNHISFFKNLEELAAYYVYALRSVQPQGPYFLSGWSFGATVAFEMARQILASHEKVEFLGLLDGWAAYPSELQNEKTFKQLIQKQCDDLYQQFHLNQLKNPDFWVELQWQRSDLLWRYKLRPVNTAITLFKAKEGIPGFHESYEKDYGWHQFTTKPVEVYEVPGDHASMFQEPYVQSLAGAVSAALNEGHMVH